MLTRILKVSFFTFFLLSAFPVLSAVEAGPPVAKNGLIDLSSWSFEEKGPIDLNGEWKFVWEKEGTPENIEELIQKYGVDYKVPNFWTEIKQRGSEEKFSEFGYGTYLLRIKGLNKKDHRLALYFGTILYSWDAKVFDSSGTILWSNSLGKFGTNEETMIPWFKDARFDLNLPFYEGDLYLLIKVANFQNKHGGIFGGIKLGKSEDIVQHYVATQRETFILLGILIIMALYHLGLYSLRREDFASLAFAGVCSCVAIRTFVMSGLTEDFFGPASSFMFEMRHKVEYISLYLLVFVFHYFLMVAFGHPLLRKLKKLSFGISASLSLLAIPFDLYTYAMFLPLFQIWIVIICLCVIVSLVLSTLQKVEGAKISLIGFFLFFICAANDILVANKVLAPPYILSYGLVMFIFAQSYMLSLKFASTYKQVQKQGAELERKNIQLKQQEEARTLFFHNTSHELRTPLNGIIGFSELLLLDRFGKVGEEAGDKIKKIRSLAQSLTYQVNTILDLAKSKKGELELNNSMFALNDLRAETQILSEGLSLKKSKIKFSIGSNYKEAEDLKFIGDKEKILTIIRNLLGNAFKFTSDEEGKDIRVKFMTSEKSLKIIVSDSGIGIPKDQQTRIFEEFQQVEGDARRKFEGTGLGLAMVKDFVTLMGGAIDVESEVDIGSKFTITVPESAEVNVSEDDEKESDYVEEFGSAEEVKEKLSENTQEIEQVTEERKSKQQLDNSKYEILVVDDNETNVEVVSELLKTEGFNISQAYGGRDALVRIEEKVPDLVLLDLMMPEVSGEDVLKAIREGDETTDLPVVLLTARAGRQDKLFGLEMGADDYLSKPIVADELSIRVRNILARLEAAKLKIGFSEALKHEKMVSLGIMVAGIAHEINNPLGAVKSMIENTRILLDKKVQMEESQKDVFVKILDREKIAIDRIDKIVKGLLQYSRNDREEMEQVGIAQIVENTISLNLSKLKEVELKVEGDDSIHIKTFPSKFSQILGNFISNASDACKDKEAPLILVKYWSEAKVFVIEVSDNGDGVPEEILERIYDPFFTTKDVNKGTGLGLALCRKFANEMGGQLEYRREEDRTYFSVIIDLVS